MYRKFFEELQASICQKLTLIDGSKDFITDNWSRPTGSNIEDGGGITRVLEKGQIFEKAGVNFSEVRGKLPPSMSKVLTGHIEPQEYWAMGVSLVIHPYSPLVPTTHANLRYLQVGEFQWFGGGMDLTPYYLFPEDCKHFHTTLKNACDKFNPECYAKYKENCDTYFYLPHRQETRGIGGLFFDYLGKGEDNIHEKYFPLLELLAPALMQAYLPIVEKRQDLSFTPEQKHFQLLRRGRYAEFNLAFDRGTKFGLETGGRTESILMSLPPEVIWEYNYLPVPGSPEEELINTLKSPRDWI